MTDKELKAFNAGKAMVIGFIEGVKRKGLAYDEIKFISIKKKIAESPDNRVLVIRDPGGIIIGGDVPRFMQGKTIKEGFKGLKEKNKATKGHTKTKDIAKPKESYANLQPVNQSKADQEAPKALEAIDKVPNDISDNEIKKEIRKIIQSYAENIKGYVDRDPSVGAERIFIAEEYKNESLRGFNSRSPFAGIRKDNPREQAKAIIYAIQHTPEAIAHAKWEDEWTPNIVGKNDAAHSHPNDEFRHMSCFITYQGRKQKLRITVARKLEDSEERANVAYFSKMAPVRDAKNTSTKSDLIAVGMTLEEVL